MDEVQKPSDFESYTPSSKSFRFYVEICPDIFVIMG
jgi:hypothetical protein